MKIFTVIALALLLAGCEKDEATKPSEDVPKCYTFRYTDTISMSPDLPPYPQTTTFDDDSCGITYSQAIQVRDNYDTTYSVTNSGYTMTVVKTCEIIF